MNRKTRWWVTAVLSSVIIAAVILLLLFRPNCAEQINEYTVTFINQGQIFATEKVKHGENVPFAEVGTPTMADTQEDGEWFRNTFAGWYLQGDDEESLIYNVKGGGSYSATEDVVFVAAFEKTYISADGTFLVRFYDSVTGKLMEPEGGDAVQHIPFGESAVAPVAPEHEGYEYPPKWNRSFDYVTGNIIVIAQYMPRQYTLRKHILGEVEEEKIYFNDGLYLDGSGDRGMLKFVEWYWNEDFTGEPVSDDALMGAGDADVYAKYKMNFDRVFVAQIGGDYTYGGEKETVYLDGITEDSRFEYICEWTLTAPDGTVVSKSGGGEDGILFNLQNSEGRDIAGEYSVRSILTASYKSPDGKTVLLSDKTTRLQNITVQKKTLNAEISVMENACVYGTQPNVSVSFSGFEYGDADGIFEDRYSFSFKNGSETLKTRLPVGVYTVSAEIDDPDNYSVNIINANSVTVRVDKKNLKVSLKAEDFIYGDEGAADHFTVGYDAFAYGEEDSAEEILGAPAYSYTRNNSFYDPSERKNMNAGEYAVRIVGFDKITDGAGLNYAIDYSDALAEFTVAKRDVSVTMNLGKTDLMYGEEQSYSVDDSEILEDDRSLFSWNYSFIYTSVDGSKKELPYTHTAGKLFDAGKYVLTVNYTAENDNYNVIINGNGVPFNVAQKDLTVCANVNRQYTYGESVTVTVEFDGFVQSENIDDSDVKLNTGGVFYRFNKYGSQYTYQIFGAGDYTVEYVSGYSSNNYAIESGRAFHFEVVPKTLNITLSKDVESAYYYGDNPVITVDFDDGDFVYGEQNRKDEIFGSGYDAPRYFTGGTEYFGQYFNAGSEYIVCIGLKDGERYGDNEYGQGNYRIYVNDLSFNVLPRPVTVAVKTENSVYGEKNPEYGYTAGSYADGAKVFVTEEDEENFAFSYDLEYSRFGESEKHEYISDGSPFPAAQYTVALKWAENSNYDITDVNGEFQVTRRPVTVTVFSENVTYGQAAVYGYDYTEYSTADKNGVLAADVENFLSALNESLVKDGSPFTYESGHFGAGDYTYSVNFESDEDVADLLKNYFVTYAGGDGNGMVQFTVNRKELRLYVEMDNFTYGEIVAAPQPVAAVGYGFAYGEDFSDLNGSFRYLINGVLWQPEQFTATPFPAGNNYVIQLDEDGYSSDNYNIVYNRNAGNTAVADKFTVTPRRVAVEVEMTSYGEYIYGGIQPSYIYSFIPVPLEEGRQSFDLSADRENFDFAYIVTFTTLGAEPREVGFTGGRFGAGNYTVTVRAGRQDTNYYAPTVTNATFTISKAAATVSLSGVKEEYVYGEKILPQVNFEGLVEPDDYNEFKFTENKLPYRFKVSGGNAKYESVKNIGEYVISLVDENDRKTDRYSSDNYNFIYRDSEVYKFTILPKTLHAYFVKSLAEENYKNIFYGTFGSSFRPYTGIDFEEIDFEYGESADLFSDDGKTIVYFSGVGRYLVGDYFDAGEYTARVPDLEDNGGIHHNYRLFFGNSEFTVNRKQITVTAPENMYKSEGYDGSVFGSGLPGENIVGAVDKSHYRISYTYDYQPFFNQIAGLHEIPTAAVSFRDAGEYTVHFFVEETEGKDNYNIVYSDGVNSYTVTIPRAAAEITGITQEVARQTFIYNGKVQTVNVGGIAKSAGDGALTYSANMGNIDPATGEYSFLNVNEADGLEITVILSETQNFEGDKKHIRVTVNRAEYALTADNQNDYEYNGKLQGNPITVRAIGDDEFTVAYGFDNVYQFRNAGDYIVNYTVSGNGNYVDVSSSYSIRIARKIITVTHDNDKEFTYDGSNRYSADGISYIGLIDGEESTLTFTRGYRYTDMSGSTSEYSIDGQTPEFVNAGVYGVSFKISIGNNYKFADGTFGDYEDGYYVKINPVALSVATDAGGDEVKQVSYNGLQQIKAIETDVTEQMISGSGAPEIEYRYKILSQSDGETYYVYESDWDKELPVLSAAGRYEIFYRISGNNYKPIEDSYILVVDKADLKISNPETAAVIYNNCDYFRPNVTVYGEQNGESGVYTLQYSKYTHTVGSKVKEHAITDNTANFTAAGEYTVYFTVSLNSDNYTVEGQDGYSGNYSLTVMPRPITLRAVFTDENHNYIYGNFGTRNNIYPVKIEDVADFAEGENLTDAFPDIGIKYYSEDGEEYAPSTYFDAGKYTAEIFGFDNPDYAVKTRNIDGQNEDPDFRLFTIFRRPITFTSRSCKDGIYGEYSAENAPASLIQTSGSYAVGEDISAVENLQIEYFKDGKPYTVIDYFDVGSYSVTVSGRGSGVYEMGNYSVTVVNDNPNFNICERPFTIDFSSTFSRKKASEWFWNYERRYEDFFEFEGTVRLKSVDHDQNVADDKNSFDKYFYWVDGYKFIVGGRDETKNFTLEYALTVMLNNNSINPVAPVPAVYNGEIQTFALSVTADEGVSYELLYKYGSDGWTTAAPTLKDAGICAVEYKISSKFVDKDITGSYNAVINKRALAVSISTRSLTVTYDGLNHYSENVSVEGIVNGESADSAYKLAYSGGEKQFVNAGHYTVRFIVQPTSNYTVRAGGTDYDESYFGEYTVTVNPAEVTVISPSVRDSVYDGKTLRGGVISVAGDIAASDKDNLQNVYSVTYTCAKNGGGEEQIGTPYFKDAGAYTVRYEVALNSNYTTDSATDGTFNVNIAKADYAVTADDQVYVYDGNAHGCEISVGVATASDGYSVTYGENGIKFTNAGEYSVSYSVTGNDNYNDILGASYSVKIDRADISVTIPETLTTEYSGSAFESRITYEGQPENGSRINISYTVIFTPATGLLSGGITRPQTIRFTDAGEYKVEFELSEEEGHSNYNFSAVNGEYTVIINRAQTEITPNVQVAELVEKSSGNYVTTYNAVDNHTVDISGARATFGELTVEFNGETTEDRLFKFRNAGEYSMILSVAETNNYSGAATMLNVKVEKAVLGIIVPSGEELVHEYDGIAYGVGIAVTGVLKDDADSAYTATYNNQNSQIPKYRDVNRKDGKVSAYTVDYSIGLGGNYTINKADSLVGSYEITIIPAMLEADKISSYVREYNAEPETVKELSVRGTVGEEESYMVVRDIEGELEEGEIINAGQYTVTYTVKPANNYTIENEIYSYTVTISKAVLSIDIDKVKEDIERLGLKYNGTEQTVEVNLEDVVVRNSSRQNVDYAKVELSGEKFINVYDNNTLVFGFAQNSNYGGAYSDYTETYNYAVAKADYTVETDDRTYVYDGRPHGFGVTVIGVNGDELSGVTVLYDGSEEIPTRTNANENGYVINYTVTGDGNYNDIGEGAGRTYKITIEKAPLTVTKPNDIAVDYDGEPHGEAVSVTGYENITSEISSVYSVTYNGSNSVYTATDVVDVRVNYRVEPSGNYKVVQGEAEGIYNIKISPVEPVLSVESFVGIYNGADQSGGISAEQGGIKSMPKVEYWLEEVDEDGISLAENPVWTIQKPEILNTGHYFLHIRLSGNNYIAKEFRKEYTIEKAEYKNISGKADDKSATFGDMPVTVERTLNAEGVTSADKVNTDDIEYSYVYTPNIGKEVRGQIAQDTVFTDAGRYIITCTIPETRNYKEYFYSHTVIIARAEGKIDASGVKTEYTYTGAQQTVAGGATTNSDGGDDSLIYSDNNFTTVAEGNNKVVTISLPETNNFTGNSATVTLSVKKAELTVVKPDNIEVEYDGEAHGQSVAVTGVPENEQGEAYTVAYNGNSIGFPRFTDVNRGADGEVISYTVYYSVTLNENYSVEDSSVLSGAYTVRINPLQLNVETPSDIVKDYDKVAVAVKKLQIDGVLENDNSTPYNVSNPVVTKGGVLYSGDIVGAGKYAVSYTVIPGNNYYIGSYGGGEKTYGYSITINRIDWIVTLPEIGENLVYTGKNLIKSKDVTVSGLDGDFFNGEIDYSVTYTTADGGDGNFNGEFVNAGKYAVAFSVSGNGNYRKYDGEYTVEIDRAAGIIDVTELENHTFVYTGEEQTVDAVVGGKTLVTSNSGGALAFSNNKFTTVAQGKALFVNIVLSDTENYYGTALNGIGINVEKASYDGETVQIPAIETQISVIGKTLDKVVLPAGWRWANSLEVLGTGGAFSAVYNADPANYNDYGGVNITVVTRKEKIAFAIADYEIDFGTPVTFDCWMLNGEDNRLITAGSAESGYITITCSSDSVNPNIGGTYVLTYNVSVDENDYFCVDDGVEEITEKSYETMLKIKSVDVGGILYTIEDALNIADSGTVTVLYNTSFAGAEIKDRFEKLYTDSGFYTVKQGVTLLLPYDSDGTVNKTLDGNNKEYFQENRLVLNESGLNSSYLKLQLIVPDNLVITNNGTISVGGKTTGGGGGKTSGQTAGDYAVLTLGANSKIESNGDINAFGFIAESNADNGSEVKMNSGTLLMPFIVVDHRGGSVFSGVYNNMNGSPFNRFFFQNITAKLTVSSDAALNGWANLYASNKDNTTTVFFIGNGNSCFLQLDSGSHVEWKYTVATKITAWDICGNATFNALSLTVIGQKVSTETVMFPLTWYWRITLKPGESGSAVVTSAKQSMKIMPGASFTVDKNVTLTMPKIFVYDSTFEDYVVGGVPKYESSRGDGEFIVNGKLNVKELGGNVRTTGSGAELNVTDSNTVTSYELSGSSGSSFLTSVTWQAITKNLTSAVFNDGGNKQSVVLNKGGYISKNGGWITEDSQFAINYQFAYRNTDGDVANPQGSASPNNPDYYTSGSNFELSPAYHKGWRFIGWFEDEECGIPITKINGGERGNEPITLFGLFREQVGTYYDIVFTANGDGATVNGGMFYTASVAEGELADYNLSSVQAVREGYSFLGWYKAEDGGDSVVTSLNPNDFTEKSLTLYARWKINTYKLTLSQGGNTTLSVTVDGGEVHSGSKTVDVPFGAKIAVTASSDSGYSLKSVLSEPVGYVSASGDSFNMPAEAVKITTAAEKDDSCIAEGTLIMLPDGTRRAIEELSAGDKVLIFNHETGEYEDGRMWFIDDIQKPAKKCLVINLEFGDGTDLRIIYKHALFDINLNKYVYITQENAEEFIGHRFAKLTFADGEFVRGEAVLSRAYLTEEFIRAFGPISEYHMNLVTDSFLSMPSFPYGIEGFINIFEYGEDMRYENAQMEADIDKYGIFTYEDFAGYMSYEDFVKTPAKWLKVALGKGALKWEEVEKIIPFIYDKGGFTH